MPHATLSQGSWRAALARPACVLSKHLDLPINVFFDPLAWNLPLSWERSGICEQSKGLQRSSGVKGSSAAAALGIPLAENHPKTTPHGPAFASRGPPQPRSSSEVGKIHEQLPLRAAGVAEELQPPGSGLGLGAQQRLPQLGGALQLQPGFRGCGEGLSLLLPFMETEGEGAELPLPRGFSEKPGRVPRTPAEVPGGWGGGWGSGRGGP